MKSANAECSASPWIITQYCDPTACVNEPGSLRSLYDNSIWSGDIFRHLIEGRTFRKGHETYTWRVQHNTPDKLGQLLAMVDSAYHYLPGNVPVRAEKLMAHPLLITMENSEKKMLGFVPLKRGRYGWKTSLFGGINRYVISLCLKDFCDFLLKNLHQLPYIIQVNQKLACAMLKLAPLPVISRKDVYIIKKGNIRIPTPQQVAKAVEEKLIPDIDVARENCYLSKVSLSLCSDIEEVKILIGNPIMLNPVEYRHKSLDQFVLNPQWQSWCERLKRTPRSGYAALGYDGTDVVNLYQHSERVAKAACVLAAKRGLNQDLVHVMASIHDFAEAITGDYVSGRVDATKKLTEEMQAWEQQLVPALGECGWKLYQTWQRYEDRDCEEAKLIGQIDKFEPLVEAIEFFNHHPECSKQRQAVVGMIMANTAHKITDPTLLAMLDELKDREKQQHFDFNAYCQRLMQ